MIHRKDAHTLEKALRNNPENSSYVFYLAKAYEKAKEYRLALQTYEKRSKMPGGEEEVFYSLYARALLQEHLEMESPLIVESYRKAHAYRPCRAETLFWLSNYYLKNGQNEVAFPIIREGLSLRLPEDQLYVEEWIYDYGLQLQQLECAWTLGRQSEALEAAEHLLENPRLPLVKRRRIEIALGRRPGL